MVSADCDFIALFVQYIKTNILRQHFNPVLRMKSGLTWTATLDRNLVFLAFKIDCGPDHVVKC
jgi:hypothetical protein